MSVVDVGRRYPQVFGHRGDDGFDPGSIAGLELWLDANQIVSTDGTALASWADSTGNGHTATQGTGGSQPTYQTNELNGLPVVRFDGTDDLMLLGNLSAVFPTAATLFVVFTAADSDYGVYEHDGSNGYWRFAGDGLAYMRTFRDSRIDAYVAMPNTGSHMVSIVSSASTYQLYLDGTGAGAQAAGYQAGENHQIGSGNGGGGPFGGDIAEVLVYSAALSAPDRTTVEAYLADKWGL